MACGPLRFATCNGSRSNSPMRALRKLRRDYPKDAYVFVSERGGPISPIGFHRLIQRVGEAANMPFPIHPHMLRHACGFLEEIADGGAASTAFWLMASGRADREASARSERLLL